MEKHHLILNDEFSFELGGSIPQLEITYCTSGQLNKAKNNVVWVFHALTANADCEDWWKGLIGKGQVFNPEEHYIVCANILGSCYGTSGPTSINPTTNQPYLYDFPAITIRDMVKAHQLLADHLNIEDIQFAIGGSMGGYQLLEWNLLEPERFKNAIIIASSLKESAWGIAIHEAHRKAIEADATWRNGHLNDGRFGLKAARSFGMILYRSYESYLHSQEEEHNDIPNQFKAASYIAYQGEKFTNRFNAISYHYLLSAMDTHNVSRGRSTDLTTTLNQIQTQYLIIGISSDYLCPTQEQKMMKNYLKNSTLNIIDSKYGHDGFLVEHEIISSKIREQFNI